MRRAIVALAVLAACAGLWAELRWGRWAAGLSGAQPTATARQATAESAPTELVGDIDGDGNADRVWISKVEGRTPIVDRRLYVEALVGGTHASAGPYSAVGLAERSRVRRLPPELDDLQILPPTSLGLADVNLDGRPELVARFSTIRPGRPTLATVLAWDATTGAFRELFSRDEQALLCMDATGSGQSAMFSFEIFYPDIPIVRNVSVWDGAQFVPTPTAESAVPASLARRLLDVYDKRRSHVSQSWKSSFDSAYRAAAEAAGRPYSALSRVERAVQGLGRRTGEARQP